MSACMHLGNFGLTVPVCACAAVLGAKFTVDFHLHWMGAQTRIQTLGWKGDVATY